MTENRLAAAAELALIVGKELLTLYQQGDHSGELKADHTLVTRADRHADGLIEDFLQSRFPGEGILSEEKSTVYPSSEHAWVIDPLDGTVNFSQGLHYWGISIAHLVNGMPQTGAVYFPLIEELYTAERGTGAFLNGNRLSINPSDKQDLFPLFVHCSRMHKKFQEKLRYKKRSLGAAAYHLCLVAKNTATLALESTPKIWDYAAGWLIIEEAGGEVKALGTEQPFPAIPGLDYAQKPFSILAAHSAEELSKAEAGIIPIASKAT